MKIIRVKQPKAEKGSAFQEKSAKNKKVNFLSDLKKEYITNLLLILNSFLEYGLNSKLKNK